LTPELHGEGCIVNHKKVCHPLLVVSRLRRRAGRPSSNAVLGGLVYGCGVDTVVMESTGVSWIPIFEHLDACGDAACQPAFGPKASSPSCARTCVSARLLEYAASHI